jgi:minor extracellular serine protease Vpr
MRRFSLLLALYLLILPTLIGQVIPNQYLVELQDAPAIASFRAGAHRTAKAQFAAARNRVLESQKPAIRALQNGGGRLVHQVDTILNGIIVEMPDAKAAQLAQLPGVKRVTPVHVAKAQLDRALPMHKIAEAWNNLPGGADSAGMGMKIGMIDTGVDVRHPGFIDNSRPALDGYPKFNPVNEEIDRPLVNSKVIVMRSYENLVDRSSGFRLTASDNQGHGTGTAFAAVGRRIDGPYGPISGAAPGAYLGVYRITPGDTGSSSTAAILAALDDAVKDGMDVINLSFGSPSVPDDDNDEALQRIKDAGVIFIAAIGNQGPGFQSTAWPAGSRHAIGIGASGNDRQISTAAAVELPNGTKLPALSGNNTTGRQRQTGLLKDAANLGNELACDPFPAGSLADSIVLILRGTCTFEIKLNNAQAAGAKAGVIYNPEQVDTGLILSQVSNFTTAVWMNNDQGRKLKAQLAETPDLVVTVNPTPDVSPNRIVSFSSMGPSTGSLQIKPDLVAVGDHFVTASPVSCCSTWGDEAGVALTRGFVAIQGTSFSSPLVAGAAAVLKQSRPGLTVANYRSLLTNTADPLTIAAANDRVAIPFEAGTGRLNLSAAQRANAAVTPSTLSFGGGTRTQAGRTRTLTVTNLGTETDTFTITTEAIADSTQPGVSNASITLEPRASTNVEVTFAGTDLRAGSHHGNLLVQGTKSDVILRVPYWYGVPSTTPGSIAIIVDPEPVVGARARVPLTFRVTDTSGQALDDVLPEIEPVTTGGTVISVDSAGGSGLFRAAVRAGSLPGLYVYRIKAGEVAFLFGVQVQ